jgi:hypothetical protein
VKKLMLRVNCCRWPFVEYIAGSESKKHLLKYDLPG